MFRDLMPLLLDRFHMIAPDLPGFGKSDMPGRGCTFDQIAATIDHFTEVVGFDRYAVYVFDYGAPTGFRLAVKHPERITAIISQNGNAYEEGLSDGWNPIRAYWEDASRTIGAPCRQNARKIFMATAPTNHPPRTYAPTARPRVSIARPKPRGGRSRKRFRSYCGIPIAVRRLRVGSSTIPTVRPGVAAVQYLEGPRENDLVAERPTSITLPRPPSGQAKANGDERTFEAGRAEADRLRELEHRAVLGEHASAKLGEAMLEGVAQEVPQQHAAQPVTLEIGTHCEADVVFDDPGNAEDLSPVVEGGEGGAVESE
jgi:pimeloyl-ACP methyl ester carboxylesterase